MIDEGRKVKNLPVSPEPSGLTGLKCFNPNTSPASSIYKTKLHRELKSMLYILV